MKKTIAIVLVAIIVLLAVQIVVANVQNEELTTMTAVEKLNAVPVPTEGPTAEMMERNGATQSPISPVIAIIAIGAGTTIAAYMHRHEKNKS